MKPDTITIIPIYLIISICVYRHMGVHFCDRIGVSLYGCNFCNRIDVSLYGCNRVSVSLSGGGRFMKPAVNVGVVTSIF